MANLRRARRGPEDTQSRRARRPPGPTPGTSPRRFAERVRDAARTEDPQGVMLRATAEGAARPREYGDAAVPAGIQTAAAWSWRFLLIVAAIGAAVYLLVELSVVVIPVVVAVMLAALLQPGAAFLTRRGWPRALSATFMLIVGLGVVAGIIWLVIDQISTSFSDLSTQVGDAITSIREWLVSGPLQLSQGQINNVFDQASNSLVENQDVLTSGALTTALTVGHVLTGAALVLFTLFFFLLDGRGIWSWLNRLFPRDTREAVNEAATRSWRTLISYVRATAAVALFDAVIIGIGLAILQVPLFLPLAALVFLGAFIPIIGSFLSGLVAVLVALVSNGWVVALIVLGLIIAVMQFEGHVLQPLLLGRAVKVHPLAVVLSIAAGLLVAGIFGALIAVPLVACLNVATTHLMHRPSSVDDLGPPGPSTDGFLDPKDNADQSASD